MLLEDVNNVQANLKPPSLSPAENYQAVLIAANTFSGRLVTIKPNFINIIISISKISIMTFYCNFLGNIAQRWKSLPDYNVDATIIFCTFCSARKR